VTWDSSITRPGSSSAILAKDRVALSSSATRMSTLDDDGKRNEGVINQIRLLLDHVCTFFWRGYHDSWMLSPSASSLSHSPTFAGSLSFLALRPSLRLATPRPGPVKRFQLSANRRTAPHRS